MIEKNGIRLIHNKNKISDTFVDGLLKKQLISSVLKM